MNEFWEGPDIKGSLETDIKENIYCELASAIYDINHNFGRTTSGGKVPVIPSYYGVQIEISLQVAENTNLGPSLTYTDPLGAARLFTANSGLDLRSTATRTDVLNSYYSVDKIDNAALVHRCKTREPYSGSSLLLASDLGIYNFLKGAAFQADLFPSSQISGSKQDAKVDVYSYQVKFEIVSNGSVNPAWKLSRISGDTAGSQLISAGRTRTHYLLLTFGPTLVVNPLTGLPVQTSKNTRNNPEGVAPRGSSPPTQEAINAHLAQQIGIAVQNSLNSN